MDPGTMNGNNWSLQYWAGYDLEDGGAAVWREIASGDSRVRASICFAIATLARPNLMLRLSWLHHTPPIVITPTYRKKNQVV